jgi:uncharacterized protein (UPF0335 family)
MTQATQKEALLYRKMQRQSSVLDEIKAILQDFKAKGFLVKVRKIAQIVNLILSKIDELEQSNTLSFDEIPHVKK